MEIQIEGNRRSVVDDAVRIHGKTCKDKKYKPKELTI